VRVAEVSRGTARLASSSVPGDRYPGDVMAGGPPRRTPTASRAVPAVTGEVVEEVSTGWCGAVVDVELIGGMRVVVLEDRHGRRRSFPLGPGFLLDGQPVELTRAPGRPVRAPAGGAGAGRTASGSIAVPGARAQVARDARIWVEGKHDAELVERVWGDDLRLEGVVVEMLDGIDDLPAAVRGFGPGPGRRLGVLVDHLVPGSKESRVAAQVARLPAGRHVTVVGHPYVDVWAAVRPSAVGIPAWPDVPPGIPWKEGVVARLGWGCPTWEAWRRIFASVHSWRDLEPALLGRVEELVDFVTTD